MVKVNAREITGIAKTAFTPLYTRAKMGFELDAHLVAHSFKSINSVKDTNVIIRTTKFDEFVKNFISRNPNAVIGNFGAGFCTRFWRVDNGQITWTNYDLKEIIDIRKSHLPQHSRSRDAVWDFNEQTLKYKFDLIIAEGFFPYLEKSVALRHITGEIIFDLAKKFKNELIRWSYDGEDIEELLLFSNNMLTGKRASGSRKMWFIHAEPRQ